MTDTGVGKVKLTVKPTPKAKSLLRSLTATFASTYDVNLDEIDDLKIISDESLGLVMSASENEVEITLDFDNDRNFTIELTTKSKRELEQNLSFAWVIAKALSDNMTLTQEKEVLKLKAKKKLSPRTENE